MSYNESLRNYTFFDFFINIESEVQYLSAIESALTKSNSVKTFFYMNSYAFYLYEMNDEFRLAILSADFLIPDGQSIVWAVKTLYKRKINKVVFTYSFNPHISNILLKYKAKIFFLGGTENELIHAIDNIKEINPNLLIVGHYNGYFSNISDTDHIIDLINKSGAEVLIVAMGMPRSEIWINRNKKRLNVKLIFSVGGFLSFASGKIKMAPKWLFNTGLEWLHRLFQEPKRLIKRYLISNSFFVFKVIKKKYGF